MLELKWPEWLDDIWAKSPDQGGIGQPESLASHTLKVLEKLSELINLRPFITSLVSFNDFWNCLFWALFLHDFGKSAKGFQEMLRGGKGWGHRHEVFSIAFLAWMQGFSEEECLLIASIILSHHKEADELFLLYPEPSDPVYDPINEIITSQFEDDILKGMRRWLVECTDSWINKLGLIEKDVKIPKLPSEEVSIASIKEHGNRIIRYWLKAYRKLNKSITLRYGNFSILKLLLLRGHAQTADHMASAHVEELPQITLSLNTRSPYERLGLKKESLYTHQKECSEIIGSVILMAPTGSGKTESALLWALNQAQDSYGLSRVYYTLPFQASMNAMYDRLTSGPFPGQVGLEHSKNLLTLYRFYIEDAYNPNQAKSTAKWLKELVRLNYYPIKILSPYQMLKAFYRIKGYESILTDLAGACVVFDEIHAYEPDRLAMILCSAEFLRKESKCKFFVMSATLPTMVQKVLHKSLNDPVLVKASPELFKDFTRHRIFVLDGDLLDEFWIDYICKTTSEYNSILVCCNTVSKAQKVYSEIKQRVGTLIDSLLIHSRFNVRDRLEKEKIIIDSTGSRSTHRRPLLLVSTQVIEVSMDIDFDVIFTDPAPVEALIQRFGRVNRRRTKKWAPVYVFTKPEDGQKVYSASLVKKAIEIFKENHEKTIDEELINIWLDDVYQGEILEAWNDLYQKSYADFYYTCIETLKPFSASESLEEMFYQAFDAVEALPSNFEKNYIELMKENPLEAAQLLVPLRWAQLQRLKHEGKVRRYDSRGPFLIDAEYGNEFGMMF